MNPKETRLRFGAVYFRKSNPPVQDWERDHRVAAEDGHTLFRHWVSWNAVEIAPGRFAWDDYDRQMDLAAENGIQVILAEMLIDYPEWLIRQFPHARVESRSGAKRSSEMHVSCATGGHYALCLDNPEVSEAAERFLVELATRYREHPALYGYDIWNENTYYVPERLCFCSGTQRRFREWLKRRYGSVENVARQWRRYSLTDWEDVQLSRQVALYADVLDTLRFQVENAFEWMRWRRDILRQHDPDHLMVAHGVARSYSNIATTCGDDWRGAELVDIYGYTQGGFRTRHANFLAGDLIRGAARGKPFWRAETIGYPSWTGRELGKPGPHRDAMCQPENIRLDCMIATTCGIRAYQSCRWRPLLDGPLFGALGWYGMDGSRNDRSAMVAELARWASQPELDPLWRASPAKGEVALLILEESQAYCYAAQGNTDPYAFSVQGAYGAFLDANIQCDFVRIDDIDSYDLIYVPFPVALADATVEKLRAWVERGGCLVAEGCCGYMNDYAHAFPQQPNRGLDEVFGCVEEDVSFALDRLDGLEIRTDPEAIEAGIYQQSYTPRGGTAQGWYNDGRVAIVDNRYGKGFARLVGSMPGYAYHRSPSQANRKWFASLLTLANKEPRFLVDQAEVVTRLWTGDEGDFVWVVNPSDEPTMVTIIAGPSVAPIRGLTVMRGDGPEPSYEGRAITVRVASRDAAVLQIAQ